MPKKSNIAAQKPRRRVSVGRKPAQPEVPFDTQVAIEQAIAGLGLEEMRRIILSQERQLNSLRLIMFDFQTILRTEVAKRDKPITKDRFNKFTTSLRATIEANIRELVAEHPNPEEVNELSPAAIGDQELDDIITQTFGPLADWANVDQPIEGEEVTLDDMAGILEQAVAETEDAEDRRSSATTTRPPREQGRGRRGPGRRQQ